MPIKTQTIKIDNFDFGKYCNFYFWYARHYSYIKMLSEILVQFYKIYQEKASLKSNN